MPRLASQVIQVVTCSFHVGGIGRGSGPGIVVSLPENRIGQLSIIIVPKVVMSSLFQTDNMRIVGN